MSDDIVAAHLAAALIQAGSQKLDAKTAATIYFDCLEAVRAERQKRYEPPTGGTGIDGPGGSKGQPATTARGSGSGGSCPIGVSATPVLPTVALMQKHEDGEIVFRHACKLGLEGIVSKRKDSTYRSGRSPDWLKMKNPGC